MQPAVIHNVQVLRFIAAGSVLLLHIFDLMLPGDSIIWRVPWVAGVDIFFVISGFIMTLLTHEKFGAEGIGRDFLVRRAIRIVPPYWFFTTLMVLTVLLLSHHVRYTTIDGAQLATSYSFLPWPRATDGKLNPILSQGWTLNYEAFFYVAFALALFFRRGLIWLAAGFAALAAVHPWIPGELFMLSFWSEPIILEFVGGIGLARLYLTGFRLPLWGTLACIALAIGVFVATATTVSGPYRHILHFGVPAYLFCAGLILAPQPKRIGWFRRMLERGGDASYTLYLAHPFVINAWVILWGKAGIGLPWLGVVLGFALAVGVAMIFFRLVERPFADLLRRRFAGRSA